MTVIQFDKKGWIFARGSKVKEMLCNTFQRTRLKNSFFFIWSEKFFLFICFFCFFYIEFLTSKYPDVQLFH